MSIIPSQDLIHDKNTAFINRCNVVLNELIEQAKNQINIFSQNRIDEDLDVQGRVLGLTRPFGMSDENFRVIVNAKKAVNRTDCTIESIEQCVAIIINNDFEITDNRTNVIKLTIFGETLTDIERKSLLNYLPSPSSAKWEIIEEGLTSKYNHAVFGVNKYISPQTLKEQEIWEK